MDFFSGIDAKGSQYPAFYFDTHIADLKETIHSKENSIRTGRVDADKVWTIKAEIERDQKTLEEIERTKPHLSDPEKNLLYKAYKEIGKRISQTLFSRSEMMMGLASPHEEAKRMTEKLIDIKEFVDLAKACKVELEKGKASRNGAAKIFKIVGKIIGEPTNIEVLRKDKATARTRKVA